MEQGWLVVEWELSCVQSSKETEDMDMDGHG